MDSNLGRPTMSDSKSEESVPTIDSIKLESESASEETAAETISEDAVPPFKIDSAELAESQKDEKADEELEESMPKSNDKAIPEKPEEPYTTAAERKDSSSSQKSAASESKESSASDSSAAPERKQSSVSNITISQRKQSPTSDNTAPAEHKQSAAGDIATSERKQSSACDTTTVTERKKSSASDTSAPERKQSSVSNKPGPRLRKKTTETEASDELQDMIKEISESKPEVTPGQSNNKLQTGKETTENLISVLEDGMESQTKEKSLPEPPATTSVDGTPAVKPPKPKKYLYKLKSKTGKILHYTSTVPITLKRPIIHLTKMQDTSGKSDPVQKVRSSEKDDVDSDNSSKENNVKENEAPNENVMKVVKKKGRPPLSSRPPPPVITLDDNASDTSDDPKNKSSASFSMQTRKRQLKFLPDGRLITPEKRVKTDDKNQSSSSDSDIDVVSDTEKSTDTAASDKPGQRKSEPGSSSLVPAVGSATLTPKKFRPDLLKMNNSLTDKRKYKKVFDYESYYREKSGIPSQSGLVHTSIGNRSFVSNLTPIRKVIDTPKLKPILPSSSAQPKKPSSVDPAQLLSSLIGVPISSNQLNVVKFKPKIIQERANTIVASTPKKVTFEDDGNKYAPANQSELLKSTPFKIVSKPTYQKILPKPSLIDRTPISQTRLAYQPMNIDNKFSSSVASASNIYVTSNSPFLRESLRDTLAKFETFTDTKVVKTKEGPKRCTKRKLDEDVYLKDNNSKTLYDLMYEIFEKMPSWNLHVVPDTNCFCIAQVSRGRMGIPTLKKSIEINSEFFAKVYVHQLQCKRYDGIYDTESKIIKLIKEIDALAA